jgi:hypothetical protein
MKTIAQPEFPFIPAGQTTKVYISAAHFNAFSAYMTQTGKSLSTVLQAQAFLQEISFGDGTGYLAARIIGDPNTIQCACQRWQQETLTCPAGCMKRHYNQLPASNGDPDAPCGYIHFSSKLCLNADCACWQPCDPERVVPCTG